MQNNDALGTVACCRFLYSGPFAVINIIKAENLPSLSLKNGTSEVLQFMDSIKKSDKKNVGAGDNNSREFGTPFKFPHGGLCA